MAANLSCAHCETRSASMECVTEDLLYCNPCSTALHSKRARRHHSVKPFKVCDECEGAVARVMCGICAGKESEQPLVFCVDCSEFLHSKKARRHHRVEHIAATAVLKEIESPADTEQGASLRKQPKKNLTNNTHDQHQEVNIQNGATSVTKISEDADLICVQQASWCSRDGGVSSCSTETKIAIQDKGTNEACLQESETVAFRAPRPEEGSPLVPQDVASTRIDEAVNAKRQSASKEELGEPRVSYPPQCQSTPPPGHTPTPLGGLNNHPAFTSQHWHFPYQSTLQGGVPVPSSNCCPHCLPVQGTPLTQSFPPRSTWDGLLASHGYVGSMPPSCHPHAVINPSGLMSHMNHLYMGFQPHFNLFSSAHLCQAGLEPCPPVQRVDSIQSKSEGYVEPPFCTDQADKKAEDPQNAGSKDEVAVDLQSAGSKDEWTDKKAAEGLQSAGFEDEGSDKKAAEDLQSAGSKDEWTDKKVAEDLQSADHSKKRTKPDLAGVPASTSYVHPEVSGERSPKRMQMDVGEKDFSEKASFRSVRANDIGITAGTESTGIAPLEGLQTDLSKPAYEVFLKVTDHSMETTGREHGGIFSGVGSDPARMTSQSENGGAAMEQPQGLQDEETPSDAVSTEKYPEGHSVEAVFTSTCQANPKEEPLDDLDFEGLSAGECSPDLYIYPKATARHCDADCSKKEDGKKLQESVSKSGIRYLPARRPKVEYEKEVTSKDSSEESYSEGDTSTDDKTFGTKKYRRGNITIRAVVLDGVGDDEDKLDGTIGNIIRMLKHGLSSGMIDVDARKSVKSAQKCLIRYNLVQAGSSKRRLPDMQALEAGSCVVEFVSLGPHQRCSVDSWTYRLAATVANYFTSKCCTQKLKVSFYGIKQNAMCAGHAFADTFNRVMNLSANFLPEKLLDEGDHAELNRNSKCPNKSSFCRKSRMAYRKDLVDALYKISKSSRWQQELGTSKNASKGHIFAEGSASLVRNVISHADSLWMAGVPKHESLVETFGHETVKMLILNSRKVCEMFLEDKQWCVLGSRLEYPIL